LYFSANVSSEVTSRRMKCLGNVTPIEKIRIAYKILVGKSVEKITSGDQSVDGRIILKRILENYNIRMCDWQWNNNKRLLRSNTKCYGGKTHYTDS
jgi:hypothetical protein